MNAQNNFAQKQVSVAVCKVGDFMPGIGIAVLVNDQQVALFKLRNGDIHAVGNYDPFSEANVISRGITGDLKGFKVVTSPIYKQHFDLATGQCLEDASVSLPVFPVQVSGDQVSILV